MRALDEMERMSTVTLYTYASSAFPQRSDHILGDILDYAGADAGRRRFDAGLDPGAAHLQPGHVGR